MKYLIAIALLIAALVGGYQSGSQPKRDGVAFAEERLDISLESKLVDVGEVELNVVFAGPKAGPPVILLHGYPEFWYAWRGPMAVLAKAGFRVIVPDQRGYNDSDKPAEASAYRLDKLAGDVVGLIDALGYEQAYLAGHDFGGLVSWWTLMLHPDRIKSFVVVNKPHPQAILDYASRPDHEESISWYRTFLRIPILPGYVGRLGNWGLLVQNLRETSRPNTFPDEHMNQFLSAWDNDGAIDSMGAWYRANASFDLDIEKKVTTPGLFVLAPDDAFSAKQIGLNSMDFLVGGELLELERGTHWVIQEEPEMIGQILVDYFGRGAAGATRDLVRR